MAISGVMLLGIGLLLLCILFCVRCTHYGYFKKRNIRTPPFDYFFGHLLAIWSGGSVAHLLHKWTKQYGKIYGIFEGSTPVYIVSDADFLEQVFIKQFSRFYNQQDFLLEHTMKKSRHGLLTSSGSRWRRQKQIMGPILSRAVKHMSPLFNKCIDDMMMTIRTSNESGTTGEIDLYPLFRQTFWDLMCNSFGIDTCKEKSETDELLYSFDSFFATTINEVPIFKACQLFSSIQSIILSCYEIYNDIGRFVIHFLRCKPSTSAWKGYGYYWLKEQLFQLFNKRWKNGDNSSFTGTAAGQRNDDFLSMMTQFLTFSSIKDEDNVDGKNGKEDLQRLVAPYEIVDNAFLFIGALYAGGPAVIACSAYILATYPDIQKKLQDEIEQFFPFSDQNYLDENIVSKMPYLEHFLREILRMFPISTQDINRQCFEETTINGIHVAKGAIVRADVFSVHFDPELWGPEDPNVFCPERHADTKRHPAALLFFGAGPKMCPGVRFTQVTIKMMLVRLLSEYSFMSCENNQTKLNISENVGHLPSDAWVKLIPRR